MNARRLLIAIGLIVIVALVIAVLPAMAQGGTDCPTCPVSFNTPSILDPNSRATAETATLFYVVLGIATFIFVLVEALLIFSVLRFRNRPASEAIQIHGNTKLEVMWTAIPALILAVLLGFTLRSMANIRAPVSGEAIKVKVIGHQWWWEFDYPDLKITTANQLVVPAGKKIDVELTTVDVQHGFWAPQLFGKMDAVAGHTNRMNFSVNNVGEYGGQCTQMCGEQHAQMRLSVVALSAADFQKWATDQQQPAPAPAGDAAIRGQKTVIEKCAACHTIGGTTAAGKVGPNLTHVASRDFIAGGILKRTDDNLKLWIQNPQAVKVSAKMPSLGLDSQTINDVVAYLDTLK